MKPPAVIGRMTEQRRAILEEIQRPQGHPTADEVYHRVKEYMPHISLGTVYRNLDLLSQRGLIRRVQAPGGQTRFDGELHEHYHVRCTKCGRIDNVAAGCVSMVAWPARSDNGFEITGCSVEFEGICATCGLHT